MNAYELGLVQDLIEGLEKLRAGGDDSITIGDVNLIDAGDNSDAGKIKLSDDGDKYVLVV